MNNDNKPSRRAVLGLLGNRSRFEYAAIGDMVNLTSRVMNLSKTLGHTVVVSESTRNLCHQELLDVEWEDLGPQTVKGRKESVHVFGVSDK